MARRDAVELIDAAAAGPGTLRHVYGYAFELGGEVRRDFSAVAFTVLRKDWSVERMNEFKVELFHDGPEPVALTDRLDGKGNHRRRAVGAGLPRDLEAFAGYLVISGDVLRGNPRYRVSAAMSRISPVPPPAPLLATALAGLALGPRALRRRRATQRSADGSR